MGKVKIASLKFTIQSEFVKSKKKPLKIKGLTTVIVHQIDLFSKQTIKLFKNLILRRNSIVLFLEKQQSIIKQLGKK